MNELIKDCAMCGICGIAYEGQQAFTLETLIQMRDVLTHRGPDDAGHFIDQGIALGSRRLSILDLSPNGHMPMSTRDGRFHIVFNGEIYNFREFHAELEAKGYVFRSGSDTEVLLYLYAEYGASMLHRLNGMFAFAVWDAIEKSLFIARDRLGIKPLCYALQNEHFYFASEEKALLAAGISPDFDTDIWEELLYFRFIAGERTPFKHIRRLLPGHHLMWHDSQLTIKRWWNLSQQVELHKNVAIADVDSWYRSTFDSAVDYRRISDVPVGVLLSGGLDSSSVAASLSLLAKTQVATFTVRFQETKYDEGPLARELAEQYSLDYHELFVRPETDLPELLVAASWYQDAPLVHGNDAQLLAISRYAKPYVTVLLSGEGADEILGGYVRYRPLMYANLLRGARLAIPLIRAGSSSHYRMRKLARFLSNGSIQDFILYNACDVLPVDIKHLGDFGWARFEYRRQVLDEAQALYPSNYFRQAMYSDQHTFLNSLLDRNDRMTMGASIECRAPFLDYRLVEQVATLPNTAIISRRHNKALLRRSIGDRLPQSILQHPKWGFGVPWTKYMRELPVFRDRVASLPSAAIIQTSPFNRESIQSVVDDFFRGSDEYAILLRQLLMITLWYDELKRRLPQLRLQAEYMR